MLRGGSAGGRARKEFQRSGVDRVDAGKLRRPWFAGGTIRAVSVQGDWHQPMGDESGFEDGTLNFLSIPDVEFGLRWLGQRAPSCAELTLIHGDFRIGNLLVGPEGLAAVIDWEFAHVGDPHEDLAWPCVRDWRFGNDALHVGGVGELAPYLAAYESAAGRTIDHNALRWWEIMGNLRWAATCHVQAQRHLSGADPSVELASLGRRAAEMELEFLTLIEALEGL